MRMNPAIRTLGLLVISAAASFAASITYNFTFVSEGSIITPVLPTAGSFTYNTTTATFSNFTITWDGYLFDFTSAANSATVKTAGVGCTLPVTTAIIYNSLTQTAGDCSPFPDQYTWIGSAVGPNPVFKIYDTSASPGTSDFELDASNSASVIAGPSSSGLFNPPTTVPEPSTFFLALAGGGLLLGRRLAKAKQ